MKDETFRVMYQDYLDYQGYYKNELDWDMEESFEEYIQRSIDNGELDEWADSNRFFSAEDSGMTDKQIVELIESQFWNPTLAHSWLRHTADSGTQPNLAHS